MTISTPLLRMLVFARRSHMGRVSRVARPHSFEVPPRLGQAQAAVRATSDDGRVVLILPVVLPEADRADVVSAPFGQRHEAAAWATVRTARTVPNDVVQPHPRGQVGHGSHDRSRGGEVK